MGLIQRSLIRPWSKIGARHALIPRDRPPREPGSAAAIDRRKRRPYTAPQVEPVAQSVEHVTFNHGVVGSNPAGLTNKIKHLYD